ncbi:MAG TPA: hypothetical protein VKR82_04705 [Candidatus Acidoferrales bacterium]|nr:hypothetical protein [Candidatus Acidoferrales bacterium]
MVDNGPSQYSAPGSGRRNGLSCFFYSTFVVKQYDEGQKGSEWLAIAPFAGRTAPACTLTHTANEKVITYPEWGGYFLGAKGRLVFFRAADGFNAGMPFVVYDSKTETKVFEEDSFHDTSIFLQKAKSSPFNHMRVFEEENDQFILKYLRVVEAGCDLHSEKSSCWESVRKTLKLQNTEVPVCTGYEGISARFESAVAYPVEVTLFPKPVVKTIEGPVRCWPVD